MFDTLGTEPVGAMLDAGVDDTRLDTPDTEPTDAALDAPCADDAIEAPDTDALETAELPPTLPVEMDVGEVPLDPTPVGLLAATVDTMSLVTVAVRKMLVVML